MGKGEEESEEKTEGNNTTTNENPPQEENSEDNTQEQEKNQKNEEKPQEEKEEDAKKNSEDLRKVIKVGVSEEKKDGEQEETTEGELDSNTREGLEQKRAILQSIKDFDFQIKKNQEEITVVNKKLESVSKDLDDLVSLYEIVSEQMNPFVGLSKVTKKRIDALENFTKEIEDLKGRMGDIEAFAEKTGINFEEIKTLRAEISEQPSSNNHTEETEEKQPKSPPKYDVFSEDDIDNIINKSLDLMSMDDKIDEIINEFIESILDENIN
jgi:flagellar protein FlaC